MRSDTTEAHTGGESNYFTLTSEASLLPSLLFIPHYYPKTLSRRGSSSSFPLLHTPPTPLLSLYQSFYSIVSPPPRHPRSENLSSLATANCPGIHGRPIPFSAPQRVPLYPERQHTTTCLRSLPVCLEKKKKKKKKKQNTIFCQSGFLCSYIADTRWIHTQFFKSSTSFSKENK